MTAATDEGTLEGTQAHEYKLLDTAETNTYVSKLSAPKGCIITIREDIDAYVNYTLSGKIFTFHE